MNHWKRSFTLTCLCAVLTAGSLAAAQEPRMAAAAQMAMGNAYARGDGVEKNPQLAQKWYDKARISPGMANDIVDGVTQIDTSSYWTPVQSIDFSAKHDVLIKNSDGSYSPMDEAHFESEEIAPGTWKIRSDGDYCYLLEGDKLAVMIDCGYGAGNLRDYAQTLTKKPVKYVINTHYHFDHTANDAYFDAAFMTAVSVPYATVPYDSFQGVSFPRNYPVVTVTDGYKLNLGHRELTILTLPHPNHTLGGLTVLDASRRILFTGDEFLSPTRAHLNISLADFAENMEHLNRVRSQFDVLYGGPGKMEGTAFDAYYQAAMYGISPAMTYTLDTSSSPKWPQQALTDEQDHTVYERGRVRPGDKTKNAPEIIPQGQRASYTYEGFTVSFILPANGQPQPAD